MEKTLVLVADFINEIVNEKGAFGAHNAARVKADKTIQKANELISWARSKNVIIAHVKVGFDANYSTCSKSSPMFKQAPEYGVLKLGTWGTEFYKEMDVQEHDMIVVKQRVSALYGTNLEVMLRANDISRVVVCGVSTSYVVESTVRELHDRDYSVTVISDACNAATQESHDASLSAMQRLADIQTLSEFLS